MTKTVQQVRNMTRTRFSRLSEAEKWTFFDSSKFHMSNRGRKIGQLYMAMEWALDEERPEMQDIPLNEPDIETKVAELAASLQSQGRTRVMRDAECPVCYEGYGDEASELPVVRNCGHHLCAKCFVEHFEQERRCHMCRQATTSFTLMYL